MTTRGESLPVSMMVWSIHDPVIEQPDLLERQFADLAGAGFDGVAVFVRCSRYTWDHPSARKALAHISRLCRRSGKDLWIGPDPRFISRTLIGDAGGAELLLFGDSARAATVPHFVPVVNGRYSVRCALTPRHVHMLQEVAIDYLPLAVFRAYAVRREGTVVAKESIRDVTASCSLFYNVRDRYVEAFGSFRPPDGGPWEVVTFFHVRSSHVDYSDARQMHAYRARLAELKTAGVNANALMWDEPGYTCTYGSLPFTPDIRRRCAKRLGERFERNIWKLACDAADGSHVPFRIAYYETVQSTVNEAQRATNATMRRLWGAGALASIHDTWHFESADMCDMNHGSMDLWKGASVKSGGFVDLGGVNDLRDPSSGHYAHLAAMSVIAASLGRHAKRPCSFNNLWTVGDDDGEGWQRSVMDHCVNAMCLFGTRWLAHAYGPVGTIGQERTFLGSPPLPGYPDHSTWPSFPAWNRRLHAHWQRTGGAMPAVNVLLVYPVESLYALADTRADRIAAAIFAFVLSLVDAHYQVDVLSPAMTRNGRWKGNQCVLGAKRYDAVILPFSTVIDEALLSLVLQRPACVAWVGTVPARTSRNRPIRTSRFSEPVEPDRMLEWLAAHNVPRPVRGPEGAWVSAVPLSDRTLVGIMPSRHGGAAEGEVRYHDVLCQLPRVSGLVTVSFPVDGAPVVLSREGASV